MRYLKSDFIFDILGNFPVSYYLLYYHFSSEKFDIDELVENEIFIAAMLLRLLRLWHIREVAASFDRIFSVLKTIFYMQMFTLTNLHSWVVAAVKLIIVIHLFSCGWIYISVYKTKEGFSHVVEFTDSENMISVYFQFEVTVKKISMQ